MSQDAALRALAAEAGFMVRWHDVHGMRRDVDVETLRALLTRIGLPASDLVEIEESRTLLAAERDVLPPLLTAVRRSRGPRPPGRRRAERFRLHAEDGKVIEGRLDDAGRLPAVSRSGYHRLEFDDAETVLAVAPSSCFSLADAGAEAAGRPLPWGLSAQVYGLRRTGDLGLGDLGAAAMLAEAAGRLGAATLAISPVHALFAAAPDRFSPYAPSSRLFLNALHADPTLLFGRDAMTHAVAARAEAQAASLIDWEDATARRMTWFRALFARHADDPRFLQFRAAQGEALERHARFEALSLHLRARDGAFRHWRDWPAGYANPEAPAVADFAAAHADEVAFHAFCQWLADASLADAQRRARAAGMTVGLLADIAVGTDGSGSHAWSRPADVMRGAAVGAPPDLFNPAGQDWGLTAFSPRALLAGGYAAFLEVLRAAMRHAGGIRIDHAMGLERLWLIPEGSPASAGAYLRYPREDLLRLLALESHRHRAVVIGEDLGTVRPGFRSRIGRGGILGMRVLDFERDAKGVPLPPRDWTREAVAMTTTHDLATIAGWWCGTDLAWRRRLAGDHGMEAAEASRAAGRRLLWNGFRASGAASGEAPPPEAPAAAVDAAVAHVGGAACRLAILPIEDALALAEQPNIPGTTTEHPNWRRRTPDDAASLLDAPDVAARIARFAAARPVA
ncbi:4-alpha-glucanotransferase [Plastoroseomonas hellenica]|uniref:4-alpha-glucanotransferase n=1 Tax=Plastoroseomonas hellenica TaxID=2687306 RepID=UPI0027E96819|nr:4-alpha-glucanotransferase [Plastoroseomonas hellenica]